MAETTVTQDRPADEGRGMKVEMVARRELMEDGKRYIIYYTFGDDGQEEEKVDV